MKPDRTDEQLLEDYLAGRRAALAELAERYERPLLGFACGLLGGHRDLAYDAVQETWLRVIRFGEQFMGRSSFKTWVYRIGVNQCRSLLAARHTPGSDDERTIGQAADAGANDTMEKIDRNHAVRRAVEQLDADKRVVVLLCYHSGMTHEQAAEILDLPLGTLKSRLHSALDELRSLLPAEVVQ